MFSSRDLIKATSGGGRARFCIRDGRCLRICLLCEAEFEQTNEGFAALNEHEFLHGMGTLFPWSELEGKTLRMVVIRYEGLYDGEGDLYAIDDGNGVVYHLCHKYAHNWREGGIGGWKWKIGKPMKPSDGRLPMPYVQALRLIGSKSTGEK